MKKKILISILMLMIGGTLTGCGSSMSSNNKSDWEQIKEVDISHAFYDGGFYNEDFGITVGYAGETHYTTDGGESWPKSNNKSFCRFGLDIVNEKVAYSCGNAGNVRKTTDGGVNWEAKADYGESENEKKCRYIRFSDENTGWMASLVELVTTKDGADTWQKVTLPQDVGQILAIELVDDKVGYFIDTNKKIYKTKDFGKTWDENDLDVDNFDNKTYSANQMALGFTSENDGQLFFYGADNVLTAYKTVDGGKTWKKQNIPEINNFGPLYITHDGKYLSAGTNGCAKLRLFKNNK